MGRACGTNREKSSAYRILVGKPWGKRPLRRPLRTCVDNIKMDVKEIWWGGMDCIDVDQDRDKQRALLNTIIFLLPSNSKQEECHWQASLSTECGSYYPYRQTTKLLIVKGYFKSLSRINTVPISTALANVTPTQMDQASLNKLKCWVKGTVRYSPQKPVTKKKLLIL
jgi:hypothetical protein